MPGAALQSDGHVKPDADTVVTNPRTPKVMTGAGHEAAAAAIDVHGGFFGPLGARFLALAILRSGCSVNGRGPSQRVVCKARDSWPALMTFRSRVAVARR